MTTLSLTAPLTSLLDVLATAGVVDGVRGLAKLRCGSDDPAAYKAAETRIGQARRAGPRVRLSTLAGYARAAGYVVQVGALSTKTPSTFDRCAADDLDVTVSQARALLVALGLEMSLAVEPMREGSV